MQSPLGVVPPRALLPPFPQITKREKFFRWPPEPDRGLLSLGDAYFSNAQRFPNKERRKKPFPSCLISAGAACRPRSFHGTKERDYRARRSQQTLVAKESGENNCFGTIIEVFFIAQSVRRCCSTVLSITERYFCLLPFCVPWKRVELIVLQSD